MKTETVKTFDNTGSRSRITSARNETARIRQRIRRIDAALVGELTQRIREVDSALLHLREFAEMIAEIRALRGDD